MILVDFCIIFEVSNLQIYNTTWMNITMRSFWVQVICAIDYELAHISRTNIREKQ